jgi:hypothetical protein
VLFGLLAEQEEDDDAPAAPRLHERPAGAFIPARSDARTRSGLGYLERAAGHLVTGRDQLPARRLHGLDGPRSKAVDDALAA